MSIERELILVKLMGFLTGEISKNEIYEWALFVAVSKDFDDLAKKDPLYGTILQFLMEIDKPADPPRPVKKIVEYFVECLENKTEFQPETYQSVLTGSAKAPAAKSSPQETSAKSPKPEPSKAETGLTKSSSLKKLPWISILARMYVLLFIAASVVLNLLAIFKSDFLVAEGEIPPMPDDVLRDAFPHLFYAFTMIVALFWKGPKFVSWAAFFIAAWGMFFYWSAVTTFVLDNQWPLYYVVMLSPVMTLPPTMMFLIMLARRVPFFPSGQATMKAVREGEIKTRAPR